MKIPERYRKLVLAGYLVFGETCDAEGNPTDWPAFSSYPPPGFLPVPLFDYGNGDVNGFYWPIGCEEREPIVCSTYHDNWSVEPEDSNLEGFLKSEVVKRGWSSEDEEYAEAQEIAEQLAVTLPMGNSPSTQAELLLTLDPKSPAALRTAAASAAKQGDLDLALTYLEAALTVLPEYTAALSDLATLSQRMGRMPETAGIRIEAIASPICFGGGRNKCLQWLQRFQDQDFPDLASDPLWQSRRRLTFATGVKQNDDFLIYEEAISEYIAQRKGVQAVRLRILVGELMWSETVSFRERYDYTREKHRELLVANLQAAGLETRICAVTDSI